MANEATALVSMNTGILTAETEDAGAAIRGADCSGRIVGIAMNSEARVRLASYTGAAR